MANSSRILVLLSMGEEFEISVLHSLVTCHILLYVITSGMTGKLQNELGHSMPGYHHFASLIHLLS